MLCKRHADRGLGGILMLSTSRTRRLYKLFKASEQVVQGISMTVRMDKSSDHLIGGSDHPYPSYSGGEKDTLMAVKSEIIGTGVGERRQ